MTHANEVGKGKPSSFKGKSPFKGKHGLIVISGVSFVFGLIIFILSLIIGNGTFAGVLYLIGLLIMTFSVALFVIWVFLMNFLRKANKSNLEKKAKEDKEVISQSSIRSLRKQRKKKKEAHLMRRYLLKAGYEDVDEHRFALKLFRIAIGITAALTLLVVIFGIVLKPGAGNILLFLTGLWTAVFVLILGLMWMSVYVYLDLRMYRRTQAIEEVLPDFLQLTSANISAGMPIDRALWFAVRPRFGILAKEIEEVAKSTVAGEDLGAALQNFANKYDSKILSRSISLLLEGLSAGGEMAELLNKISVNIQELKIMKKEMAASVMTYVIFITFASILAAPFLFGLATQLLIIITSIMGVIGDSAGGGGGGFFSLSFNANAISIKDFKIFCVVMLSITAFMSTVIISTIRKGTVKEGIKNIPINIAITIALYFLATSLLGTMLSGFF
ncbi:MAG: type II secretion system F family protein [Candidatus Woesearchaeota archaeon]